jgi:parvulin-like peptidyl-prolyl isomerase
LLKEKRMRIRILCLILLAAGMLITTGCSKPVATVNGKKIDKATLDLHVKEKVQEHKMQNVTSDNAKLREAVLQQLIGEKLMLEEAAAQGIRVSDEEASKEIDAIKNKLGVEQFNKTLKEKEMTLDVFKKRTREKMILRKLVESFVRDDSVTEDEMKDYYQNSQKPFIKPSRVFIKMMEFTAEAEARAVAEDMRKNKIDFDDMGKKLLDEKKANVTDYGWITPDFFSPSMALAIKNIKTGQFGGPYKGQKSYFLLKVKERENEGIAPFDEAKSGIKNMLLAQKRQAAVAQWIEQKRNASKIEIHIK